MAMLDSNDVIIEIDDFDDFDDDFRNATIIRSSRSSRGLPGNFNNRDRRSRSRGGGGRRSRGFSRGSSEVVRGRVISSQMDKAPAPAPVVVQEAPRGGLNFGDLTTGELIDSAAQGLAALTPLPAPPTATGDGRVDVENMIRYQQALAQHAKRDEQLRTIGSIAKNIWG